MKTLGSARSHSEVARYIANGLVATGIHFGVLTIAMQVIGMRSAGFANLIAAIFGTTASFLGSRYYVFKKYQEPILGQAVAFLGLYGSIAIVHGMVLYGWTDVNGLDYRTGFLLAAFFQVVLSYFGNKTLVFRK